VEDDLNSPNKCNIYWYKNQLVFKQKQLKIKKLRSTNQNLEKRLETMEHLMDYLKNKK
jgi:hypothetical protein